jgi:hypothetical protein
LSCTLKTEAAHELETVGNYLTDYLGVISQEYVISIPTSSTFIPRSVYYSAMKMEAEVPTETLVTT